MAASCSCPPTGGQGSSGFTSCQPLGTELPSQPANTPLPQLPSWALPSVSFTAHSAFSPQADSGGAWGQAQLKGSDVPYQHNMFQAVWRPPSWEWPLSGVQEPAKCLYLLHRAGRAARWKKKEKTPCRLLCGLQHPILSAQGWQHSNLGQVKCPHCRRVRGEGWGHSCYSHSSTLIQSSH